MHFMCNTHKSEVYTLRRFWVKEKFQFQFGFYSVVRGIGFLGAGVVFSILVLNLDVREVERFGKECSDGWKDEISYHCWLDFVGFYG